MLRKRIDTLAKAQELRDPIRRFAGESQSRIEQDLLMLQRGIGSQEILRRWAIYKKLVKLRKARKTQRFSPAQEAELQALQQAAREAEAVRIDKAEEMMQEVRGFGRYPMESRQDVRERQLADKLRKARKAKRFSPAQEVELQVLQQAARDAAAKRRVFPDRKAWQKEYDAKRRATPHRKAKRKERYATPLGKAKQKEYQRKYLATPHGKAKSKEFEATPYRMATLHGKETTSGRPRAEGGELPHCRKRKR